MADETGATRPSAEAAAAALRSATAAQRAARSPGATPRWYPVVTGLLCAAGFGGLGLSLGQPRWAGLLLGVGVLCLVGFLAVSWAEMHRGGVAPWFGGRGDRSVWSRLLLPLAPLVVGVALVLPYGMEGGFIGFGVTAGVSIWLRAARPDPEAREAS